MVTSVELTVTQSTFLVHLIILVARWLVSVFATHFLGDSEVIISTNYSSVWTSNLAAENLKPKEHNCTFDFKDIST